MSMFRPPSRPSPASATSSWSGTRVRQAGDRTLAYRDRDADVPSHRREATAETFEKSGKRGLTNAVVLDRTPDGCLFAVGHGGFFDKLGYWCVKKADGLVEVRRGAQKKVMRLLTEPQRKELARARLQARRHGLR